MNGGTRTGSTGVLARLLAGIAGGTPVLLTCFGLFITSIVNGQTRTTPRDVVIESNRQEMDRLLLRKPIGSTRNDSIRLATLKQINDDFRDLQVLNNKMMAEATSFKRVDYRFIENMIAQIGNKAARLKTNLALPKPETKKEERVNPGWSSEEFKTELMELDRVVMSFATNPIFQKVNVVELELARRASNDLAVILEQSGRLKKAAAKLAKWKQE